jgi:DNA-binding NtrC family response regulator
VEDEESVRELVRTTLEKIGYKVLDAGQGDTALEVAASHVGPIDILISDVVLPGINGRELGLKLSQSYPGIKILFVSGYPEEMVVRQEPGIAFLQKPFTLQALSRKVQDVMGSSH